MTIGTVAEKLNVPVHRINYLLRTRPHIHPPAVAARTRLFDNQCLAQLRYELNRMEARRERGDQ